MGEVRRVLITGASGFIGQATVSAARAEGLEVVAVQRGSGTNRSGVLYVCADLTVQECVPILSKALEGCDAVIHLAATMSGDAEAHERLTVHGTQNLIAAMLHAGVPHLTLASSIAVFDTCHVPIGGELTDACPLEDPADPRDAYSGAKVRQEELARAAGFDTLAVLRPGIVYDSDAIWNAHLGIGLGPVLFRFARHDRLPMCHVDRCAAALVRATRQKVNETFTILDAEQPTRGEVIDALRQTGWPALVVPLPSKLLRSLTRLLRPVSANLPGLLRDKVLRQRGLPMGNRLREPDFAETLPNSAPDWRAKS